MSKVFSADEINLNVVQLLSGTADPTAGLGVARAIGSLYARAQAGSAALFLKTGSSATAWSKLAQSLGWKSVKDYGAAGDGVVDDTAAIQQAITDVNYQGGGVVFFPYGTYLVTQITLTGLTAVQLWGSGPSSVLKWSFNAASAAGSMVKVSAASARTVIRMLRFDGSGLTNPASARSNHLVLIDGTSGGVTETRIETCTFGGMVAGSGDGVHVVGSSGNLVSRLWVHDCEFDGCSRYSIGVEQGWQYGWVTDNYLTNCETEIAVVATANATTDCLQIARNEINHTGTVRHGLRLEGDATALISRLICRENLILGGFATLSSIQYANFSSNSIFSGAFSSSDPVVRVFGGFSDALISYNIVDRDPSASAGTCITLESSGAVAPIRFGISGNSLIQEVTGAGFIKTVDCSSFRIGNNLCRATNAGSTTIMAIDCQAATAVLDVALIIANQVTAAAGTYKAAVRLLANGANVAAVSVVGCQANQVESGCRFEVAAGGNFSSSLIMMAGNNFNATTSDFVNVGGAGVVPRIGANAGGAAGCQIFEGTGSPETAVTARAGSLYLNASGGQASTIYYKETGTGNTGWLPIGGSTLIFGTNDTTAAATAVYLGPGFLPTANATEIKVAVTRPGTIRNLRVQVATAGVGAQTVTYTVRKNGADTALLATIGNTSTGSTTDLSDTVSVAAGDLISLKCTKTAGVTSGQGGVVASMELA